MEIIQSSLDKSMMVRPIARDGRVVGILFYENHSKKNYVTAIFVTLLIIVSAILGFKFGIGVFLAGVALAGFLFWKSTMKSRLNDESSGIKYLPEQITEIKVLDEQSCTAAAKSLGGTLSGAAIGGALFGGAGAVVGAIASGNKISKEEVIYLGMKFTDGNWVLTKAIVDDTLSGKINRNNIQAILALTPIKQSAPF